MTQQAHAQHAERRAGPRRARTRPRELLLLLARALFARVPLWALALALAARAAARRARPAKGAPRLRLVQPRRSLTFALRKQSSRDTAPGGHDMPPVTLTQHVLDACSARDDGLARTLLAMQLACRRVSSMMRQGVKGVCSFVDAAAPGAETCADFDRLDALAADAFTAALTIEGAVCTIALSSAEQLVCVPPGEAPSARAGVGKRYAVVVDPLDGGANADAGVSVGSVFGIFEVPLAAAYSQPAASHVLRPASELVAAGYAVYGSSTLLVLSTGAGVHGFTLDPALGEFVLTRPFIHMPARGRTYAINHGHSQRWQLGTAAYVDMLTRASPPRSLRYIGTMVADLHRIFLHGGIFLYPAGRGAPMGKLRLLYEAGPMAWLAEQAGGAASSGDKPIVSLVPAHAQQCCPLAIGSTADVCDYARVLAEERHALGAAAAGAKGAGDAANGSNEKLKTAGKVPSSTGRATIRATNGAELGVARGGAGSRIASAEGAGVVDAPPCASARLPTCSAPPSRGVVSTATAGNARSEQA